MSVSQNLLASFSTGSLPGKSSTAPVDPAGAAQKEGLPSFADVLSNQQPDDVAELMQLLGDAEGDVAEKLLGVAELAADGKKLPAGMKEWLSQLDELRSETGDQTALLHAGEASPNQQEELSGLVEDWSQWLGQARQFIGSEQGATIETDAPAEPDAVEALAAMAGLVGTQLAAQANQVAGAANAVSVQASNPVISGALSLPANDKAVIVGEPGDPSARKLQRDAAIPGLQLLQDQVPKGERESRQEPAGSAGLRAMAERGGQVEGQQPVQRNLDMTPAAAEGKAAFAGKLAESLEALGGRQTAIDKDSGEALLRPGAQTQAAAQGALAARPVLAASQTLNVPFGQAGWGDAVMDKMLWMSSQNLRSVEIRLDPADLGPLEIHIQTRGQEHQVQFVTQNPSVREALEAQMFRLREAFSQQGMDLVDVSVGDSAVDQQSRHNEEGAGSGRGRANAATQTLEADEAGMMLASAAASQAESSRLVDYYA